MPARVVKKNMPCNKPRKSPNPKKKKVVKACANGKEKIIHYGASGYGHNINAAARRVLELDMDVINQKVRINYQLVTGHVKTYGLQVVRRKLQVQKDE